MTNQTKLVQSTCIGLSPSPYEILIIHSPQNLVHSPWPPLTLCPYRRFKLTWNIHIIYPHPLHQYHNPYLCPVKKLPMFIANAHLIAHTPYSILHAHDPCSYPFPQSVSKPHSQNSHFTTHTNTRPSAAMHSWSVQKNPLNPYLSISQKWNASYI